MAYDYYVAIYHPLHYFHPHESEALLKHDCYRLLGGVDGLMRADVPLSFPYYHSQEINHLFCEASSLVHLACAYTRFFEFFRYVCCVLMLFISLSLILASCSLILTAVLHAVHSSSEESLCQLFLPGYCGNSLWDSCIHLHWP
ncbi:unnamed protein product [Gulo gulo]|uniref:Uncharacterized protein n=1 Tax=Gulo gulo TaxID=48420 RepID=A0A9X9LR30_GULGU|nr:unnamed protein product [Gulo gulo]